MAVRVENDNILVQHSARPRVKSDKILALHSATPPRTDSTRLVGDVGKCREQLRTIPHLSHQGRDELGETRASHRSHGSSRKP